MKNTGHQIFFCSTHKSPGDRYMTGMGSLVRRVHNPKRCQGEHCVIHNPSDHPMVDSPTHWRQKSESYEIGYPLMERICPHDIGHPDPDHIAFVRKSRGDDAADADNVHGCDGCCTGYGPEVRDAEDALSGEGPQGRKFASDAEKRRHDILTGTESD